MYLSLKNKNFRNLLIGQGISQFGDAGYYFMFIFLVNKITQSSTMVGYMGALEALPFLLLGPLAGSIADRIDRKKIMLSADLLSTVVLSILAVSTFGIEKPSVALLFITATTLSVINTFFSPAKGASIPRLVDEECLTEANSLSNAVQSMMPLFGTAIIGSLSTYVIKYAPEYFLSILSGINALTFFGSAFFISLLPKIEPEKKQGTQTSVLTDTLEGIQYILKRPVIRVILIAECILYLFLSPFIVAMLKVNQMWFNADPKIFTYTEVSFCLGMLISSLIISKIKIIRPAPYYIIATTICAIGAAGISLCKQAELLTFVVFTIGLTTAFSNVPVYTYIQHVVKDEFQGRVNSAVNMVTLGVTPLGLVVVGKILDVMDIEHGFLLMGFCTLIPVILTFSNKDFRKATFKQDV